MAPWRTMNSVSVVLPIISSTINTTIFITTISRLHFSLLRKNSCISCNVPLLFSKVCPPPVWDEIINKTFPVLKSDSLSQPLLVLPILSFQIKYNQNSCINTLSVLELKQKKAGMSSSCENLIKMYKEDFYYGIRNF